MASKTISELPAAALVDLDDANTLYEIADMGEASPADQSKSLNLGMLRDWLSGLAGGATGFLATAVTMLTLTTAALTLTAAANTSIVTSTGYSLTAANDENMVDLAGTWNTTGAPVAFKVAITNTASDGASLMFDWLGGAGGVTSLFKMTIAGVITAAGALTAAALVAVGGFGCNTKAAQAAAHVGAALAGYMTGAFGLDSDVNMHALYDKLVAIETALIANGICVV